jgi:hypothetical protein
MVFLKLLHHFKTHIITRVFYIDNFLINNYLLTINFIPSIIY